MKIYPFLGLALVLVFLGFTGCASTKSTADAGTSSPAVDKEAQPPVPPPSADTADATAETPALQPAGEDASNQIIPIEKLPKKSGYPYGIKTKWTGLVKSPYAQDKTLVDVSAMASGTAVRCPHTGKIFIVP